jgi:hypothetical protein
MTAVDTPQRPPAHFLVDREGIVRWAHVETPGQRRQNAEILERIDALG